jgi:hypothetical protein
VCPLHLTYRLPYFTLGLHDRPGLGRHLRRLDPSSRVAEPG